MNEYSVSSSLRLTRVPFALWSISFLIILMSTVLLLHLTHSISLFPNYEEGHWWQYMIIVLMYVLALVFFLFGKLEVVCFDKTEGIVTFRKWILCYKWRAINHRLSDVFNVNVIKGGVENVHSNTIHYKVCVSFTNGVKLLIGETKSEREVFVKAMKIRKFLNIDGEIQLRDNSNQI